MSGIDNLGEGWTKDDVNARLRYTSEISYALTTQRTALSSALIPVTAYILVSGIEAYRRYPERIREIAAATPPEALGRAGHEFATQIDNVHLWAVPNFPLVGRVVLTATGMVDWEQDCANLATIFDFWERASGAYRFDDGTHQAWDSGGTATPYRAHVEKIIDGCTPVRDDASRAQIQRLNAVLQSYLFLLWFDTRSGFQDTGPYPLPDGRSLLLRAFNGLGVSHFPWSADVGADMPYTDVVGAFVLEGVDLTVTDFGTSVTHPEDYLPHVVDFGLFDVAGGGLTPIGDDGVVALADAAKTATKQLYRKIAGMERREKIDAGAYVYFTFLRPFAERAGVELDWTVPRDSLDLYPMFEMIDGVPPTPEAQDPGAYYVPIP